MAIKFNMSFGGVFKPQHIVIAFLVFKRNFQTVFEGSQRPAKKIIIIR
jgi:hypothetical protein